MMNRRERILASINHREPERLAIDLGSTTSSGISAIAYGNLTEHLGIAEKRNQVYDVVQQVTQPDIVVLDMFDACVLDIGRTFNTDAADWKSYSLSNGGTAEYPAWFNPNPDGAGNWIASNGAGIPIAKMPKGATFFDQTVFPYADGYPDTFKGLTDAMKNVQWAAFPHSPWDHENDEQFWKALREKAIHLRETTDRAIMVAPGCNLFEWGTYLRRVDNFLMDLLLEPEKVEELLDALMELHLAKLEKLCHAVGDVVDIVRFCDDLGTDNGPFMAPDIYRTLFKPRHAMLCNYVKKNSSMHTFLHSCGSIYKVIPDLIEAGFDIINPVQTVSRDMDPATLKKEFGKDITFWGAGCDTRSVLNRGTPEEVREHVKRNIEIFAPGGGYVFNAVHNIMPDVPPQNIVAMYETAKEY